MARNHASSRPAGSFRLFGTPQQFDRLKWFKDQGGEAHVFGSHVVVPSGIRVPIGAQITFLHLIARGFVTGRDGKLVITHAGEQALLGFVDPDPDSDHCKHEIAPADSSAECRRGEP